MRAVHRLARSATIALWIAALLACSPGESSTSITQAELADRIGTHSAPLIIDVRTRAEFYSGHIPGAVNIPHDQLRRRLGELDSHGDREIVVYCEVGGRSKAAASALRGAGFSTVLRLEGEMKSWRTRRLPCTGC